MAVQQDEVVARHPLAPGKSGFFSFRGAGCGKKNHGDGGIGRDTPSLRFTTGVTHEDRV
jgi:hypothetical protein